MAELFILARMRASFETVKKDLGAIERRFALNPAAKLCIGDVVLLPVDGVALFPQDLRERWATELERGLFIDLAVGTICGLPYGAAYADWIDSYKQETYTYGTRARILRERCSLYEGWHEVSEEEFVQAKLAESCKPDPADDEEWDVDYNQTQEVYYRQRVEAEFRTDGILRWFRERQALAGSAGIGAKLVVINTREMYVRYEESKSGHMLSQLLGPTAKIVMRGDYVACFALRTTESSYEVFERIKPALRPRLIEDFLIFDIGQDVAALRPGLSRLEQWVDRFIICRDVVEAEAIFQSKRRAS